MSNLGELKPLKFATADILSTLNFGGTSDFLILRYKLCQKRV